MHYKKSYGSFPEALKHGDGLAVVGAFLDVDDGRAQAKVSEDLMKLIDVKTCSEYSIL